MKTLTTLLLIAALAGCAAPPMVYRDGPGFVAEDGVMTFEGEPFTGSLESVTAEGRVRADYVDGLKHGPEVAFYANEQLHYARSYSQGRKVGSLVSYWPDGRLHTEAMFVDGQHHGFYRTWYDNGRMFQELNYENGRETGLQRTWTRNGDLFANYEVREGRRYGLISSQMCFTVTDDSVPERQERASDRGASQNTTPIYAGGTRSDEVETLPFYADQDFTPAWLTAGEARRLHRIADFNLVNQAGDTVTGDTLAGKVHVATFIYTSCHGVCPPVVSNMMEVQREFADDEDMVLVSYSVTPGHDTVEVLRQFADERGIDAGTWQLLTGDVAEIYALARDSYFVDSAATPATDPASFVHAETAYLVDEQGRIRGVYNATQKFDVHRLIADARVLRPHNQETDQ